MLYKLSVPISLLSLQIQLLLDMEVCLQIRDTPLIASFQQISALKHIPSLSNLKITNAIQIVCPYIYEPAITASIAAATRLRIPRRCNPQNRQAYGACLPIQEHHLFKLHAVVSEIGCWTLNVRCWMFILNTHAQIVCP